MKVVENQIQEGNHLSHSNDIKLLLDIQDKNMEIINDTLTMYKNDWIRMYKI